MSFLEAIRLVDFQSSGLLVCELYVAGLIESIQTHVTFPFRSGRSSYLVAIIKLSQLDICVYLQRRVNGGRITACSEERQERLPVPAEPRVEAVESSVSRKHLDLQATSRLRLLSSTSYSLYSQSTALVRLHRPQPPTQWLRRTNWLEP